MASLVDGSAFAAEEDSDLKMMQGEMDFKISKETKNIAKELQNILPQCLTRSNMRSKCEANRVDTKIAALTITTSEEMEQLVGDIYAKVLCNSYSRDVVRLAELCKRCADLKTTKETNAGQTVTFFEILERKIFDGFERQSADLDLFKSNLEEIMKNSTGFDKIKQEWIQEQLEEEVRINLRGKITRSIRFMLYLFQKQLISSDIVFRITEHLLKNPDEASVDCLCLLFKTFRKSLKKESGVTEALEECYKKTTELVIHSLIPICLKEKLIILLCYMRDCGLKGKTGIDKQQPNHLEIKYLNKHAILRTVENPWRPRRLRTSTLSSEDEQLDLYNSVRCIINKLTTQNLNILTKQFVALPINSEERLVGVVNLIFDKAVREPNFRKCYANLCKVCSQQLVVKAENSQEQKVNFRKILITRCQTEFEKGKSAELDTARHQEEICNCTDLEEKKKLQLSFEEEKSMIHMRYLGNVRFICDLFKLEMLSVPVIHVCIRHLLETPEDDSLECLCTLLVKVGSDLENPVHFQKFKSPQFVMDQYFAKMSELVKNEEDSKLSSRVRFMLQNVIELRLNMWVPPRKDHDNLKINRAAEKETMTQNRQPPRVNSKGNCTGNRNRCKRVAGEVYTPKTLFGNETPAAISLNLKPAV